MKNTIKLIGIIAFVAVIGFSMAACGGNDDIGGGGGTTTATGSIKIVNNSGYSISGWISQNNKTVKTVSTLSKGGSVTYSGIPAGSCDILVTRPGTTSLLRWRKNVTVRNGTTNTVTVTSTGWTNN
jgi:hypothetical protein